MIVNNELSYPSYQNLQVGDDILSKTAIIYGVHAVKAILSHHPHQVKRLFISKSKKQETVLIHDIALEHEIPVVFKSLHDFDQLLSPSAVHQGVAVECMQSLSIDENDILPLISRTTNPLVLILDQVQDPHNLGACVRSANALGACCVVIPKDRSVGVTPTVMKVATGATVVTPVVHVTNLSRLIQKLQAAGLWTVGLVAEDECDLPLSEIDLTGPIALVMGNEGNGLRRLTKKHCDYLATIPMSGTVQSLNVSVATGVALYEVSRQRQVI